MRTGKEAFRARLCLVSVFRKFGNLSDESRLAHSGTVGVKTLEAAGILASVVTYGIIHCLGIAVGMLRTVRTWKSYASVLLGRYDRISYLFQPFDCRIVFYKGLHLSLC